VCLKKVLLHNEKMTITQSEMTIEREKKYLFYILIFWLPLRYRHFLILKPILDTLYNVEVFVSLSFICFKSEQLKENLEITNV